MYIYKLHRDDGPPEIRTKNLNILNTKYVKKKLAMQFQEEV